MGRLAARTDADREMHLHLRAATVAVRKALTVVMSQHKDQDPQTLRRVRGIVGRLKGTLGVLEGIGTMQPGWDLTDPDMAPEDQKRAPERRPPPQRPISVPVEDEG